MVAISSNRKHPSKCNATLQCFRLRANLMFMITYIVNAYSFVFIFYRLLYSTLGSCLVVFYFFSSSNTYNLFNNKGTGWLTNMQTGNSPVKCLYSSFWDDYMSLCNLIHWEHFLFARSLEIVKLLWIQIDFIFIYTDFSLISFNITGKTNHRVFLLSFWLPLLKYISK